MPINPAVRRLAEHQEVDLLAGTTRLRCRVVAVTARQAALQPLDADDGARRDIDGPASLIFGHHGLLVALNGDAHWGEDGDDVRFAVRDGVQVPDQRAAARLRLSLEIAVRPLDGEAFGARLVDLSSGGLSLAGGGLGFPGTELEVTLPLPDREPPLNCRARIVRASAERTGLRFLPLTHAERSRLDRCIFAIQRLMARRSG